MKCLVIGGAGYIGSVNVELLIDAGHEVTVFDNFYKGHRDAVDSRATLIEGDLNDADSIMSAMKTTKPDAALHFAAHSLVGESMELPGKYFTNNVGGGVNMLEACVACDVKKVIFSSTCATYGVPERVPMDETLSQVPENPYGESKLMFEKALMWYQRIYGIEPVMLRYFNACGATKEHGEDHRPETHLIPLVLDVAKGKRKEILIFGDDYDTPDGTCIRDYIHVKDLAAAHILALKDGISGPFNLGVGNGYSVREVIDACRKVTGKPIAERMVDRRPGDAPRLVAAADKARDVLGWIPVNSNMEELVADAWNWTLAHPEGYLK